MWAGPGLRGRLLVMGLKCRGLESPSLGCGRITVPGRVPPGGWERRPSGAWAEPLRWGGARERWPGGGGRERAGGGSRAGVNVGRAGAAGAAPGEGPEVPGPGVAKPRVRTDYGPGAGAAGRLGAKAKRGVAGALEVERRTRKLARVAKPGKVRVVKPRV